MGLRIPLLNQLPFGLPWFIYDMANKQLITSWTYPGDIRDSKAVILTETPIPGLNYQPVVPVGGGNRKLSLTIPLVRQSLEGNILLLQQFEALRNQGAGFMRTSARRFAPNPKVLYYWGAGSVPLVWWVAKCDLTHKGGWYTKAGQPTYSEVELELILDETHPLNRAEAMFRAIAPVASEFLQLTAGVENVTRRISYRLFGGRR